MASKASISVTLPEIIDLDSIDSIRDGLIEAIEDGPVCVQAGGVARVSTNALFLLISAAETARRNHFEFFIEQPSAALSAAIERLGLDAQFSGLMRG